MPTKKTEFQGLSNRVAKMLERREGFDVEFKETIKSVEASDLVAFANSRSGGTILIGVKDTVDMNGRQCGEIVGCPVGDGDRLMLVNKASDCSPPIYVEVFIENLSATPFLRVEVPSGHFKPYATKAGLYKTRGDGRTVPLLPSQLLEVFLESEQASFIKRFKEATVGIERSIEDTKVGISRSLSQIERRVEDFQVRIDEWSEQIAGDVSDTSAFAESAEDQASALYLEFEQFRDSAGNTISDIHKNLIRLMKHHGVEDVGLSAAKAWIFNLICRQRELHPDWTQAQVFAEVFAEGEDRALSDSERDEMFRNAAPEVHNRKGKRRNANP